MTKKLLVLFLILGLSSSMVFGKGWVVPASELPQKSSAFINSTFPDAQIWKVERKKDKFKVKLSNGVDIDFFITGDWKDIKGYWTAVPFTVLPDSVASRVKQTYPQTMVVKVKREWGSYKIRLNNMMELYITESGQLLGQKFDD